MFEQGVDVTGERVICFRHTKTCDPGDVHRFDPDLELCVCKHCGQGWVRDVDVWKKLEESIDKLYAATTARLNTAAIAARQSFQRMNDILEEAMKKR